MSGIAVVGGGSGFVGKSLCKGLEKAGYTVIVVTRNAEGKENAITWNDLKENGLPENTQAVFNLAGSQFLSLSRWNDDLIAEIINSRVGTTTILKNAILNASTPPKLWGLATGTNFYPPDPDTVYDETTHVDSEYFWTKLVAQWEEAAKLPENANVRQCVFRPGMILGSGGGIIGGMTTLYKWGFGGPIGSGNQWFPWIHIDDLVGIYMHALNNDHVSGVLNAVSPKICTNREFASTFGSVLHRPSFFRVPAFILNAAFGETRASVFLEGANVYPKRVLESGYKFLFPSLREALENLLITQT